MKNSDEMFNSLLERRDRYIAEQRRKRKAVISTATPVCCLCLAVMLGVGIWRSGLLGRQADVPIQGDTPGQNEYAVYTDSVKLPENISGEVSNMIGCLVYKGKVYTQSAYAYDIDSSAIAERLVGEYVGEAKGTLDEWSTQVYISPVGVHLHGGVRPPCRRRRSTVTAKKSTRSPACVEDRVGKDVIGVRSSVRKSSS